MKSITGIALLLLAIGINGEQIFVRKGISITPIEQHSHLGKVRGYRPCGGPGQVLDWRLTNCSAEAICRIPRGAQIESEVDFIPSENISQLGLRFNLVKEGGIETVVDRPIADSGVMAGDSYTVRAQGGPTKEIESKLGTFQYILYRIEDNSVEWCSEAEFHYD